MGDHMNDYFVAIILEAHGYCHFFPFAARPPAFAYTRIPCTHTM